MLKVSLIVCVLVLYRLDNTCCKKTCITNEDCMTISSCPEANRLVAFRKENKAINRKFISSVCGKTWAHNRAVLLVCCSDFEVINTKFASIIANPIKAHLQAVDDKVDLTRHHNIQLLPYFCGVQTEDRIMGGDLADLYEFPWMALISYVKKQNNGSEISYFGCGGTIITSRYVLTAAHCVNQHIKGVRLGEYDISSDYDGKPGTNRYESHRQDIPIEKIIIHEEYSLTSKIVNDIALLRVTKEIDFSFRNIAPICLPIYERLIQSKLSEKVATVAGWGVTETGRISNLLLKVSVLIHPDARCGNNHQKKIICAGGGGKDSCKGDSGGPLMYMDEYNATYRMVQYGIVSQGSSSCSTNPGIYTDVRKYVRWILDKIKK